MGKPDDDIPERFVQMVADALHPVFYPIEQQCMQIQAENRDKVERAARAAIKAFMKEDD